MKYTYIEESPFAKSKFMVKFDVTHMPGTQYRGSLNVIGARVLGLNYVDYLKLLRDRYGAEINGKYCYYPVPYFNSQTAAIKVQTMLEARLKELLD